MSLPTYITDFIKKYKHLNLYGQMTRLEDLYKTDFEWWSKITTWLLINDNSVKFAEAVLKVNDESECRISTSEGSYLIKYSFEELFEILYNSENDEIIEFPLGKNEYMKINVSNIKSIERM